MGRPKKNPELVGGEEGEMEEISTPILDSIPLSDESLKALHEYLGAADSVTLEGILKSQILTQVDLAVAKYNNGLREAISKKLASLDPTTVADVAKLMNA